jgi:hypothetical protein
MGPEAQKQAQLWGTNLGSVRDITAQQQAAYDSGVAYDSTRNNITDQFGANQAVQQDKLLSQYDLGVGFNDERYNIGVGQLNQGLETDLATNDERYLRDVTLAQMANNDALGLNSTQRGVLDQQVGIRGQQYGQQVDFLNQQSGLLGDRQNLAYNQFNSADAYAADRSGALMAQYGFAGQQFEQNQAESFANRLIQERAATSDSTSRGAFGSAGFRDNMGDIQTQYDRGQDANSLQLDRTNENLDRQDAGIGQDREGLRFGYEGQQIGFNSEAAGIANSQQQNLLGYQSAQAGFEGQYAQNDATRKSLQNLDKGFTSLAAEYGIKEKDLRNQYDNSIEKMGLDLNETNAALENMLNSGNAQLMAQATQFQQQMMAYQ